MGSETSLGRKGFFFFFTEADHAVLSLAPQGQGGGQRQARIFGLKEDTFQDRPKEYHVKKGSKINVRMLHCTSPQSLVDSNLLVVEKAQRAVQEEEGLRKKGEVLPHSKKTKKPKGLWSVEDCRAEKSERSSSLVVVGRVGEGELQPIGFGQQDADFLVTPVHCGKVLQEDHQALLGEETRVEGKVES